MIVVMIPILDYDGSSDDFDGSGHGSLEPELPSHGKTSSRIDVTGREFNETTGACKTNGLVDGTIRTVPGRSLSLLGSYTIISPREYIMKPTSIPTKA